MDDVFGTVRGPCGSTVQSPGPEALSTRGAPLGPTCVD